MAATYEPIATTTLGSATATVTFSSIPGTYTDLRLIAKVKETSTAGDSRMRFNGDTGTNYNGTRVLRSYSTAVTGTINTTNGLWITQNSLNSLSWAMIEIDINSYSSSIAYKTIFATNSNASYDNQIPQVFNFTWRNTAVVTSLDFFNTSTPYVIGSTFTLYGIKAA